MVSKGRDRNNNGNKNYESLEIIIIQKNLEKTNEEIRIELENNGFHRTISSIKTKKRDLKLKKVYDKH